MDFFSVKEDGSGGHPEELDGLIARKEAVVALGIRALSPEVELSSFLEEAAGVVVETLSVEFCRILELLPDGERLVLLSGAGWGGGYVGEATVDASLDTQAGYALVSREPVVVEDFRRERRFEAPGLLADHGVVSGLSAVIYSGGRIFGVLGAHTRDSRIFTQEEGRFLEEIAEIVGATIESKRSEEQARRAIEERTAKAQAAERRFQFLLEANELLAPSLDYATTLTTAARLAVPAIAEWCFIDVAEEGGKVHRVVVAHADPEKEELADQLRNNFPLRENAPYATPKVLRTGRAELIPEVGKEMLENLACSQENLQLLLRLAPRSYMCVPLRGRQKAFGSMVFVSCAYRYGQEDLALAEGLSRCAALALDNAPHGPGELDPGGDLIRQAREGRGVVSAPRKPPDLTPRQSEVLEMLAEGSSASEISEELRISPATGRNHIRALLKSLGAHSQLEAIARARQSGLLEG